MRIVVVGFYGVKPLLMLFGKIRPAVKIAQDPLNYRMRSVVKAYLL